MNNNDSKKREGSDNNNGTFSISTSTSISTNNSTTNMNLSTYDTPTMMRDPLAPATGGGPQEGEDQDTNDNKVPVSISRSGKIPLTMMRQRQQMLSSSDGDNDADSLMPSADGEVNNTDTKKKDTSSPPHCCSLETACSCLSSSTGAAPPNTTTSATAMELSENDEETPASGTTTATVATATTAEETALDDLNLNAGSSSCHSKTSEVGALTQEEIKTTTNQKGSNSLKNEEEQEEEGDQGPRDGVNDDIDKEGGISFSEFGIYPYIDLAVAVSQEEEHDDGLGFDGPTHNNNNTGDNDSYLGLDLEDPNNNEGDDTNNKRTRAVHFEFVEVREYSITIGDHPSCSRGVPVTLDWEYSEGRAVPIELFESTNKRRRRKNARRMLLSPYQRRNLLWRCGHDLDEIEEAAKANQKRSFRQSVQLYFLPVYMLEEFYLNQREKFHKLCGIKPDRTREAEKASNEAQVRQLHKQQMASASNGNDPETGTIFSSWSNKSKQSDNNNNTTSPSTSAASSSPSPPVIQRRISFRGSGTNQSSTAGSIDGGGGSIGGGSSTNSGHGGSGVIGVGSFDGTTTNNNNNINSSLSFGRRDSDSMRGSIASSWDGRSAANDGGSEHSAYSNTYSQTSTNVGSEISGAFKASVGSKFRSYNIRTDPRQHDKATEIILCSIERPHMRAFHGSWFGFFIGFVMWFAITPLLGEVKETLNLTNAEIWTSSMCGTAVTVLARVMMGPLCDVFGARRCMAAIVIVSAIPCGLTGLVHTASGLSAVRAFIGIAGSAFVPCQYWTSRMFAREVAGTANALVAGWGNLGGGVTQLLMGSALFPLFELMFQDHDNASELAWRTVFVVPSIIAFLAAYVYIFHCEDSPKGDFAELVRQQQIELVSPFWSLGMAIQNRNVILLLIQYACCFGVEITMTNATALYMKDEFGLDTVAAAAVASVFGIMNLFARGLGGYGSDYCNSRWGTKGRVVWQTVTLFMEGAGIVVFAFAETLIGAIFSLVFLSLWVQCSEGSTYGIVPYVNRRFTGAVVGWIGGGGTMGGVIFSIFFREFSSYRKAFVAMGLAAAGSSLLSIFINMKSLTAIYHEKTKAENIKNNNNFVFHDDAPIHFHREGKRDDDYET